MEDVRFKYHELLVELDAAISKMMMLVSAGQMTGPEWLESAQKHHYAYEAWRHFLRAVPAASDSRH
ncbi:hypothetical protein ABWL43_18420 [Pseudomonas sp. HT11]|uniref:hypothetical protein n=1 Tax=Pseudomonas sp. HT11 TaxID=3230490 RepID=UPI00384D8C41